MLGSHFVSNWCKLLFVSWSVLEYVSIHFALPCYYSSYTTNTLMGRRALLGYLSKLQLLKCT